MKFFVWFATLLAFKIVVGNNMTLNVTNYHQLHKKYMAQMTRKFVDYHLYFQHDQNDKATCDKNEHTNVTQMIFNSLNQYCPNINHKLKVLSRSQVSWKNRKEEEEDAQELKNKNGTVREDAKNNMIHQHLLFVMMLPKHPFSQELHHIISTVIPMFPQVHVVIGNAIEFKDMCSKYGLHSFPRIMYFKQGKCHQIPLYLTTDFSTSCQACTRTPTRTRSPTPPWPAASRTGPSCCPRPCRL